MSAYDYYLSIGGGAKVRIDLDRVLNITREQNSLASSWVKITTEEEFVAAPQWSEGAKAELFLDNTRIFCGTIVAPVSTAQPAAQLRQYFIECPWRRFRRTPMQQHFSLFDGTLDGLSLGGSSALPQLIPFATLFTDGHVYTTVQAVCDYLIADQEAHAADVPVGFQKGDITADIYMRPTKIDTAMCSEVVLRAVQFCLDAVSWWDWTTELPAFNLRSSADMEVVTLPFGGNSVNWQMQRSTEQQLRYAAVVLVDQQPVGTVNFKTQRGAIFPTDYNGTDEGGVAILQQITDSLDLSRAAFFANAIYQSSQNLGWSGQVSVTDRNIATNLRPGVVVNQSGGNPDMASAKAIVQRTVDDLKTGTTTAIFTPRRPLSPQAIAMMLRKMWPAASLADQLEQSTGQNPGSSYGNGRKDSKDGGGGGGVPGGSTHTYLGWRADGSSGAPKSITVSSSEA